MRIMLDTNILISAIVFKSKSMHDIIAMILDEHKLVLSSYVINELKQVVSRKFDGKLSALYHSDYLYLGQRADTLSIS